MYFRYKNSRSKAWINISRANFRNNRELYIDYTRGLVETREQKTSSPNQVKQQKNFRLMGTIARTIATLKMIKPELSADEQNQLNETIQILDFKQYKLRGGA